MEAAPIKTKVFRRHTPEKSLLYKTVAENLETFILQREQDGRGLPLHVVKEMRAYLRCGILHYGFMRIKCSSCSFEAAVAYSCKKRGFCPSCGGKRMAETAIHLTENILPQVGYRQYVVSLPIPLRYWCATNKKLTSQVHAIIKRVLTRYFVTKAQSLRIEDPQPGGISFIQRAGSALNLNVHFHTLCLEGVYMPPTDNNAKPKFVGMSPPTDDEVAKMIDDISKKVVALVRKLGYLPAEGEQVDTPPLDEVFVEHPAYTQAIAASIKGRIAFGPHAGQKVRKIASGFGYEDEVPVITGPKTAAINGFNMHAATHVGKHQRDQPKAQSLRIEDPLPGGISFIQRAGSALNLNVHFHTLCLEGVYMPPTDNNAKPKFVGMSPPTDDEVAKMIDDISKKVVALVRKLGYLPAEGEQVDTPPLDEVFVEHPAYTEAIAASIKGRIAFGPHAGQKVRKIASGFGYEDEVPVITGPKTAAINGFNLHAATHVGKHQRDQLKRLVKYIARPPLASSRLTEHPSGDGDLIYELKSPWRDGTTAIRLSPMELLEKLAALVPPPKSHLVRHWGVFGSHSKYRDQIVHDPQKRKGFAPDGGYDSKKVKNTRWSQLLSKTFGVDVSTCPKCGGDMKIVAMVSDQREVTRYLKHLGLYQHSPPIAPARYEQGELAYEGQVHADQDTQVHPDYDHY